MQHTAWTSERLAYRTMTQADEPFAASLMGDLETFTQLTDRLPRPTGPKDSKFFYDAVERSALAVLVCIPGPPPVDATKKQEFTPIGFVALSKVDEERVQSRNTQMGIAMAQGFRGQGYGTEAILWAMDWGFRHANMHRIELRVYGYNPRAIKLYRKIGFRQEATRKKCLWHNGEWQDELWFALLQEEWIQRAGGIEPTVKVPLD